MTVRVGPSRIDRVREALGLVADNPEVVEAISAADKAAAKEAAEQAKRLAAARARVEAGVAERARQLIADHAALEAEAIRQAAERLARAQLEHEHVTRLTATKPQVWAALTPPERLTDALVAAATGRLRDSTPLPWDPAGRSAVQWRSDEARAASKAVADLEAAEAARLAPPPDDREARREAARQAEIDEAKRKAKVGKYAPGAGS